MVDMMGEMIGGQMMQEMVEEMTKEFSHQNRRHVLPEWSLGPVWQ